MSNVTSWRKPEARKVTRFAAVVLALILATLTLPAPTPAGEVFRFQGKSAFASFFSTDSSGCIVTSVAVQPSENILHEPPGAPDDPQSGISVSIMQVDQCTNTVLLMAFSVALLADQDFQVTNLNSATLDATVNVFDEVSGSFFDAFINLSWTGTGDNVRSNTHIHSQTPFFIENLHSRGPNSKLAEASGSVSIGTTNFTPEPSIFAVIALEANGIVRILR